LNDLTVILGPTRFYEFLSFNSFTDNVYANATVLQY